jgi:hypothetical protein
MTSAVLGALPKAFPSAWVKQKPCLTLLPSASHHPFYLGPFPFCFYPSAFILLHLPYSFALSFRLVQPCSHGEHDTNAVLWQ